MYWILTKIEENFTELLKRINFSYHNEEIKTECIKNHGSFSLLGKKFGPFEKGKEYAIKYFLAVPFIEKNILKLSSSEKCDNVDVQRYAITERDDQRLVRQETVFFLNKIKQFKRFLEKDIKAGVKPPLDLDKYNSYLISILDNRMLKLLKLTKTQLSMDNERRLTNSENALFVQISRLINTWRNFYLV